jgi:hypothetical protein
MLNIYIYIYIQHYFLIVLNIHIYMYTLKFQNYFTYVEHIYINIPKLFLRMSNKKKLRGFSPPTNYTDRATATCRRSPTASVF